MGATPFESFWYNVLAEGAPVNITAKYWTNLKGGPITMLSGSGWAIPRGAKNPGLACKFMKAMTAVDTWKAVAKSRLRPAQAAGPGVHRSLHREYAG